MAQRKKKGSKKGTTPDATAGVRSVERAMRKRQKSGSGGGSARSKGRRKR